MLSPVNFKKENSSLQKKSHFIFSKPLPPTTWALLDRVHPSYQVDTASDAMSDWQVIDAGVAPQATKDQEKYWKAWQLYAAAWNIDPFLQDREHLDIIIIVTFFSARVRQGYYGKSFQIKVPTIFKVLSTITTSIHLVGKSFSFKNTEEDYILPVKRLIKGLRCKDPPLSHNLHSLSAYQMNVALGESYENNHTLRQLGT